jgi:aromatic-L-amino-acid decarboxylase
MDYGVSLGRRFRALKLWFVLRYFGSQHIAAHLRRHIELAREFETWVRADADFELLAPRTFSVVVFRCRPDGSSESDLETLNSRIIDGVNATGEVFLSHTKAKGRYGIRLAVGNLRTQHEHVARAWQLVRENASSLVEV